MSKFFTPIDHMRVLNYFLLCAALVAQSWCETSHSFGTLVECSKETNRCLWMGEDNQLVDSSSLVDQLLSSYNKYHLKDQAKRNLELHIQYMEDIERYAMSRNHKMSYKIGVSHRHLEDEKIPTELAHVHVENNIKSKLNNQKKRKLLSGVMESLNWCDGSQGANPENRNICSPVKSQQTCGSCWAFAATDAIETSVSINKNTNPVALSPQQFLDCSRNSMTFSFQYCWANGKAIPGSSWMKNSIKWSSTNNGCSGGMTHAAFQYAAQEASRKTGIVTELALPYTESSSGAQIGSCKINGTGASIRGWEQAVGKDCSQTSDVNELLKLALQKQPLSIAVSSQGDFKNYKSGLYSCPNNGDFSDHSLVDHALILVGYGTSSEGDYWILKNSYGPSWGEKGFMRILQDNKINCGISIYPVIPTGADSAVLSNVVDGGGTNEFLKLGFNSWIIIGITVVVATIIAIFFGITVSNRKRKASRQY